MARKKHEEHENHERWLVSYADFITLLFAFFVVLYATSTHNEDKEREFQESIKKFMSLVSVGGSTAGGPSAGVVNTGSAIEGLDRTNSRLVRNPEIEKEVVGILNKNLKPSEIKELIPDVKADPSGVRITLSATAFFPSGSAKIRLPAMRALGTVAEILKRVPYKVVIEGHTDDSPVVGGNYETNWELAGARASSVVRFLMKVHNVNGHKLSAASYADQKPLVPNTTEANRAKNRRIEILIATKEDVED